MAVLLNAPYSQFLDDDANPLTGGFVYSYEAGTDTPKATYTDYTGNTEAENPVELDAAGRATIWIEGNYKFTVTDADGNVIRTVDHIEAVDQGGDMTKAVYDPANINQQLVGTTAVQVVTNKKLTLSAGSATAGTAPLKFTSGARMTSAEVGAVEFDGLTYYATSQQRGIVPHPQYYVLNATNVGADVNTAQSLLGVSVGVSTGTQYEFEGEFYLSKSAGTNSHSFGILFGGTATFSRFIYSAQHNLSSTSFVAGSSGFAMYAPSGVTALTMASGLTAAAMHHIIKIRGHISCSASGTLIPQYILSAAPGGAYTTATSSFFKISPLGASGANINIGNWA